MIAKQKPVEPAKPSVVVELTAEEASAYVKHYLGDTPFSINQNSEYYSKKANDLGSKTAGLIAIELHKLGY